MRAGQPKGLYVLFLTEMWERFSYYGMRALLVLYLVSVASKGGLGWSVESASQLYAWYTGLVYLTPIVGGYLADRYLGTHRSIVIGSCIIAAGHFSLAMPGMAAFYAGLALIIIGTGFFKANVSVMVGQLYPKDDPRRDSGFTIFYMGINLGALIGALFCGYLAESPNWGWHYGFGAAGVGMILGLIAYLFLRPRYLVGIGDAPQRQSKETKMIANKERVPLTAIERQRLMAIAIVSFFVVCFWTAFEQAGTSMNIFALNNTQRELFGFEIPAAWFQSINPAFILTGGPLFAWIWSVLGRRGREPSTPAKMALGLALLGLGFIAMVLGALGTKDGSLVSPLWLVAAYALSTAGELCLSPVGLSLVTKLSPARMVSLVMGIWFLSSFVANIISGYIAGMMEKIQSGQYFHMLGGLADFYLIFVITSLVAAVALGVLTPFLNRLMGDKEVETPEAAGAAFQTEATSH